MTRIFILIAFVFSSLLCEAQTGIGATPSAAAGISPGKLDITGTGDFTLRVKGDDYVGFGIQSFRNGSNDHAMLNLFGARGTMAGPLTMLSGDNISTISSRAYTGSSYAAVTAVQSFYSGTNQGAITLSTNGGSGLTERLRINASGSIGMGTTTPQTSLHIENGNTFGSSPSNTSSPSLYIYNNNTASSSAHATAIIRTAGSGSGKPYLGLDINGISGFSLGINNPSTDQFIINTNWDFQTGTASNNALTINRYGQSRVMIPTASGSIANDWPSGWGGGLATFDILAQSLYASSYISRSDERLKHTIDTISDQDMLNFLALKPITFYWNQDLARDTKKQYGLIAQEVEGLFPEMVYTAMDSMQTKSVNYQALHALSLKLLQLHEKAIQKLELSLALEKERNEQLSNQLAHFPPTLLNQIQLMTPEERKALKKLLK